MAIGAHGAVPAPLCVYQSPPRHQARHNGEITSLAEANAFSDGFRLGVGLMIEVMKGKNINTYKNIYLAAKQSKSIRFSL